MIKLVNVGTCVILIFRFKSMNIHRYNVMIAHFYMRHNYNKPHPRRLTDKIMSLGGK